MRQTEKRLRNIWSDRLNKAGIAHQIVGDETLFDVLFTHDNCIDQRNTKHHQPALAALYHQTLREQSILKSPSKLYPSLAVSDEDLHETEAAVTMTVDVVSQI